MQRDPLIPLLRYGLFVGLIVLLFACGGGGSGGNSEKDEQNDNGDGNTQMDTEPDTFDLVAQSGVEPGADATSNVISVSGIDAETPISISGGRYRIGSGDFVTAAGTVIDEDQVTVRVTASESFNTSVTATLTIGGVSADFTVTTADQPETDTTPDSFVFNAVENAERNAVVESNSITVTDVDIAVPIAISGGEYALADGSYTSDAGTVMANQSVTVRVTAAENYASSTSATLTIGGVSGEFRVTTQAAPADQTAPSVSVVFPPAVSFSGAENIAVRVTATDIEGSGIDTVTVAGTPATYDANTETYVATNVPLQMGEQMITVTAVDVAGNSATASVTVTRGDITAAFPEGNQVALGNPKSLTWDKANERLLVMNQTAPEVIAIDLSSGNRTVFSPRELDGANDFSNNGHAVLVDNTQMRAWAASSVNQTVYEIDLADGGRTLFARPAGTNSNNPAAVPDGYDFRALIDGRDLKHDSATGILFGANVSFKGSVVWFYADDDEATVDGERGMVLLGPEGSQANNSFNPVNLTIDRGGDRAQLLYVDEKKNDIFSFSLMNDVTTIATFNGKNPEEPGVVSIAVAGAGNGYELMAPRSLATRGGDHLYIADAQRFSYFEKLPGEAGGNIDREGTNAIVRANLVDGMKALLSDETTPNTRNPFWNAFYVYADPDLGYLLLLDDFRNAVFAIDIWSGERVLITKEADSNNRS